MSLLHFYRTPGVSPSSEASLLAKIRKELRSDLLDLKTEVCFNVEVAKELSNRQQEMLSWLLRETFRPESVGLESFFAEGGLVVEVGPRLSFTTAWSTNAVSICRACGLENVTRIERSRRYRLAVDSPWSQAEVDAFLALVHDRMTECRYLERLQSFGAGVLAAPVHDIPVMTLGRAALEEIDREMGLAFDDWDLDYYTELFRDRIGRNPTSVECFDIAQSNSEHSRHWFFKGRLLIDGDESPDSLFEIVQEPWKRNPNNSVIAFYDNSSAIRGRVIRRLTPEHPGQPTAFVEEELLQHVILTAETHNFPSGVAPFPGAATGTGGRIRDVHATGRGAHVVAGAAAYCVGNLNIPGYSLPWEDPTFRYPGNLASPLQIEIDASNGASAYGNEFGEPVITGYTRSFGQRLVNGERREWIKPIMFSSGIGHLDGRHVDKEGPEKGMWVIKLGGPAYRIGMGGGAASSMVQGENAEELDFNAVQRGDAEMEQKVNRVLRACIELGPENPIVSIHDQGAGGNCNVLKEIVEPEGAQIEVRAIPLGDDSLSVLEIWGAEYQEQDALLIRPEHEPLFRQLCQRERVPVGFVGRVTGDGRIVLHDELNDSCPVDLELDAVLGSMPRKIFEDSRTTPATAPLQLPADLTVRDALDRVLRLLSVGSKRFLTTKVDRSVTGLVARQPCAGPLQLAVADVAVIADSYLETTGAATAIGEQPIKGLLDPAAMARMSVGEALSNLVWARVTALEDVRCSANWMWAAKLPGEGAALHDAAIAMRDVMIELGMAVDGGKDSLSMAALAPREQGGDETVKAPGALVISAYVTCPDIRSTVTPDLKLPGSSRILFVDLSGQRCRMGGSALAQVFSQIGDESPDLEDANLFRRAFEATQSLLKGGKISAGHDRSDGGLATTLLEMAFAGDCGLSIDLGEGIADPLAMLFAEELGWAIETSEEDLNAVLEAFEAADVPCQVLGESLAQSRIEIRANGGPLLSADSRELRDIWEATSFALDKLQADTSLVREEADGLQNRKAPEYCLSFVPRRTPEELLKKGDKPKVVMLREEGSNGDREMMAAFWAAGFEPWDVSMSDLLAGRIDLTQFRGLVAVGGFSYADVLDSGKGWAGVVRFHPDLERQFREFYERPDTFTLGVCNGCQLFALLGWVPWAGIADERQPRFIQNASGRFESRFSTVRIEESPSILLRGMEGSVLGVWVAHGEGRAFFPDSAILDRIEQEGLAPLRYADDEGLMTERYPFDPNGSPRGIAALCSPDGRHLAIMPHPERAHLKWQWGWMPEAWKRDLEVSPWMRMFQNARSWCEG